VNPLLARDIRAAVWKEHPVTGNCVYVLEVILNIRDWLKLDGEGIFRPFYDALFDADIRNILTRHEQCAAHMADGYARAGGFPGV
jgi:glyoxylate carboligase